MLDEMRVFVRTVELGSISAAARNLRLSPAAASHRLQQLERRLGTRLLNRTTRNLGLTEHGTVFFEHCLEVLEAVDRAESSVAAASGIVTGSLRVTAPLGFGRRHLPRLVAEFQALHPKVEIRLRLSDHLVDLLSESVDAAIRMTPPRDSNLIARKLAACPRVLCAAPAYLDRAGRPAQPQDLMQHNCLLLRFPGSTQFQWTLGGAGGPHSLAVSGRFDADDGDALTEWALLGTGIALKPYWEVAGHLASGALEIVLPAYPPEAASLLLLYPHRKLIPAKVRAFADFLAERTRGLLPAPA